MKKKILLGLQQIFVKGWFFFYPLAYGLWFLWDKKHRFSAALRFQQTKIVSIGNIFVGGTGKTPLVHALLRFFTQKKMRVAVITRGYGRINKQPQILTAKTAQPTWQMYGDEPCWLVKKNPEVVFFITKNRTKVLQEYADQFDVFLLDDAFQQRTFLKDCDSVVFDAARGIDSLHLMPLGMLREPLCSLRRADAFFISRANFYPAQAKQLQRTLAHHQPNTPIFCLESYFPAVCDQFGTQLSIPQFQQKIGQKPLVAIAGIGFPEQFFAILQQFGFSLSCRLTFADHYPYTAQDVSDIMQYSGIKITTEKDKVRLQNLWPADVSLWCLVMETKLDEKLEQFLRTKLLL